MSEVNNNAMNDEFKSLKQLWVDTNDQSVIDSIVLKLEKLASQVHGESINLLGRIFENSDNKNRDVLKSLDYFEQAAKLNVPSAFAGLAALYAQKKSYDKAFQYAQQGADLGDIQCMLKLGIFLREGQGSGKDELSGLRWIKKAADAGDADAKFIYAMILVGENSTSADLLKAIEILEPNYKDRADGMAAWLLHQAYTKLGKTNNDSNVINKGNEWLRIAADMGNESAKNKLVDDKKNDQWKSLEDFTNGNESYSFFYTTGKVVDKRTETRSHTSSSGYGANQRVSTSHTSWQVIVLNDTDGNKFEVNPDSTLVISTGSNVDVVYVCKGGEKTGYPVIMIDKYSGEKYEIRKVAAARKLLGYKSIGLGCLLPVAIFFGASFIVSKMGDGFFGKTLALGVWAYVIYSLIKAYKFHKNNISSLSEHIESIAIFLKQK